MRDLAEEWNRSVFGLISPDALRRHLAPQVLARLRDAGVVPTGWRSVRIGGAQIDAVADIQKAGAGQTFRYRPLDALFALGPAVALRLGDQWGRPGEQLYADVLRIKGRTTPGATEAGTIRHDLGLINAVLSLVHLSDSPSNSAQESRAILGPAADDPDRAWAAAGALDGFLDALTAGQAPERRGFADVLTAVRGRIAAALWADLGEAGRHTVADLIHRDALAAPESGALIAAQLSGPAVAHPLADVLRLRFEPGDPPVDMADVQCLLRLYGCALDPWEHVVLTTSTYFEPVRS